ncbi:MAG TPA: hypothetical protein VJS12_02315 [Steroidobacteraceae bacterium]|nr:hypothetical protein [Steroidobacteraceae bacterium]
MPMMPSPVAGLTYAAIKVVGYALFAKGLNRYAQKPASPVKFGLAKTALGLVGGVAYFFLFMRDDAWGVYLGTVPVRLLIWAIAIQLFYREDLQRRTKVVAILAGIAWSYVLDGVMVILYRVVPGMEMPFC